MVRVHPGPPALSRRALWASSKRAKRAEAAELDSGPQVARHGAGWIGFALDSRAGRAAHSKVARRARPGEGARGAVAQLGERGLCKPEVVGSIPSSSTRSDSSIASGHDRRVENEMALFESVPAPYRREGDLRIRRSLITEYLSELRASCLQERIGSPPHAPRKGNGRRRESRSARFMVKLLRADGGCLGGRRR